VLKDRPAGLDELGLGDLRLAGKLHLALQRLGDAGAVAARRVGIDLQIFLDVVDGRLRIVTVLQEGPHGIENPVGLRVGDEVAAFGQRAIIARAHDQVLAAEPAIGTGPPDIDHPGEPHVVDGAEPP
jgi:hypothetical protein